MTSVRIATLLAGLAGPALAQEGPIQAPCLRVDPQPTDTVAAFEAEGWTFLQGGTEREAALAGPLLALALSTRLPPRPEDAAALEALVAEATEPRQARRFENALVFARGDAGATVEFDGTGDGRLLSCWFAAPDLPELEGLALEAPDLGQGPLGVAFAAIDTPAPEGAAEVRVDAVRLVLDAPPATPLPGAEAIVVNLVREEPRHLLPTIHGLLRAFGTEELSEALQAPATPDAVAP